MASPYPATLLINRAYYLSGIVSRELQTVSGSQLNDGLFLLNGLLEFKGTDTSLIPYFQRTEFPLVYGQERYFLENLYQIETLTFNMGVVRYPMTSTSRSQYFGQGRVDDISSLPFQWHLERTIGGSNLYVYFLPDAPYIAKLSAKYGLTDVSPSTDLSTVYDYFYIEYLRYGLAKYICHEFGVTFNEDKEYLLKTMEKKLKWVSPPDLTMTKSNLITNSRNSINWPQVNIGKGFYPP
jgi:hypothetical protein